KPGEAKGGHYHLKANEWFTLITGKCEVKLASLITGQRQVLQLDAAAPITLYVPANIAHIFINTSECENILLAYSDQHYHPEDTIMFNEF
ncbi:MAG: polysaccharide biosynthesis C-terminal domain-containing protein, partial [Methanobacterium sp.]